MKICSLHTAIFVNFKNLVTGFTTIITREKSPCSEKRVHFFLYKCYITSTLCKLLKVLLYLHFLCIFYSFLDNYHKKPGCFTFSFWTYSTPSKGQNTLWFLWCILKTPSTLCGHMRCNVSAKEVPKTKAEPKAKTEPKSKGSWIFIFHIISCLGSKKYSKWMTTVFGFNCWQNSLSNSVQIFKVIFSMPRTQWYNNIGNMVKNLLKLSDFF